MNLHPPICTCGSLRFDYGLVMFPMVWMAVCVHCGKETVCHLKQDTKVPSSKLPPERYDYPDDWSGIFG